MVKEVSPAILTVSLYNQSILSWKFVPQVVIEEMLSDYPRHYKLAWQPRHSIFRNRPSSSQCNKNLTICCFSMKHRMGWKGSSKSFRKKVGPRISWKKFLGHLMGIWQTVEWNSSMSDWIKVVRDLDNKNCGKNIVSSSLVIFAFFRRWNSVGESLLLRNKIANILLGFPCASLIKYDCSTGWINLKSSFV